MTTESDILCWNPLPHRLLAQKNTTFFCLPRLPAVHASFRMPRKRLRTSGHSKASSWCSATSKVTKMAWVGNWRWQFRLIVANTVINCYHLLPIVILLDTLKTCLYFFFDFGLSHHFKIKEQPWIYDLLIDRLNALLSSQILHLGPHRWFTE